MSLSEFKCLKCGTCCKWPGYVRLSHDDIDNIAIFLNMTVNEFIEKYTFLTRDRRSLSLIENEDGYCIFLTDEGCKINPVKPQQCIDFPHKWRFEGWDDLCGWGIKNKANKETNNDE
jgi:Fe-S-cluster containining protein